MREILFRGKTKNGKWVYGAYYKQRQYYGDEREVDCIITSDGVLSNDLDLDYEEVIPETVGQYTGLCDKNGNKIFEGDILAFWGRVCGVVRYGEGTFDSGIYCYTGFYYEGVCGDKDHTSLYENCDAEVVGNIYDTPELLEKEQ